MAIGSGGSILGSTGFKVKVPGRVVKGSINGSNNVASSTAKAFVPDEICIKLYSSLSLFRRAKRVPDHSSPNAIPIVNVAPI